MHIVKWKMWLKRLHSAWFQLPNSLRERQNYRDSETVKRVRGCQIWGWGCYTGIFFPTFGITRFYTQGFMLVRCSTASAMPPALLALVILETESHFLPRLAWTAIFLFYASCHCWDDRCAHHYDQLFSVFCPGWPGTTIQPISVSQVSMITRMSHWHPIYFLHYLFIYLFIAVLGLELRAFTLSHSTRPFCDGYFQDRVSRTICLGWLRPMTLLNSASWAARIIDMNHWHLDYTWNF
jgi:hypothetical protein